MADHQNLRDFNKTLSAAATPIFLVDAVDSGLRRAGLNSPKVDNVEESRRVGGRP